MDNDSTHTSKAAQDFKAKNKQELMTAAVKDWQSITRKKKTSFDDVYEYQTSGWYSFH